MPNPPLDPDSSDTDLESLMAEYIERIEAGEKPDPSDFLRHHPQHAKELRSFFENHHWMDESATEDLSDSMLGKTIGSYKIESEIARGGMGVVYRASQSGLARPVALKVISSGVLASREERKRFRIETEAAAGLQHPGIIPIHEVGVSDGFHYFSMPLIEGPTLQKNIDQGFDSPNQAAALVIMIADSVQFAHAAGILHRDLKPENILLSDQGEPLLTDFGLAKFHQDGTMVTRTGQVLGTPHFMSPEQASSGELDVRSDVYSIGAILYALLTGKPPHQGEAAAEVMRSVIQDDPVSPRSIRKRIPATLERICERAIARDRNDRYGTANELADDLRRFLDGSPVAADNSGLLDQMARELRRDQHQSSFAAWGNSLAMMGFVIFVAHLVIGGLEWMQLPKMLAFWFPRLTMFGLLAAIVYWVREGHVLPRTVAERPVYSIWLGYLASLGTVNLLVFMGVIHHSALFPISAAMSGFGFLAMSGHVWGGTAILGFVFLVAAVLMPAVLMPGSRFTTSNDAVWMPAVFGALWFLALLTLSRHYRHR